MPGELDKPRDIINRQKPKSLASVCLATVEQASDTHIFLKTKRMPSFFLKKPNHDNEPPVKDEFSLLVIFSFISLVKEVIPSHGPVC